MSIYSYIKEKEGFRATPYSDAGKGIETIGYGRTTGPFGPTTREAEDTWLKNRVDSDKKYVQDFAKEYGYSWDNNQVDALTSFVYNLGRGGLQQLTAGGKRDNETIGSKLLEYNKAGGKTLPGLVTRRQEESAMFTGNAQPKRSPRGSGGPLARQQPQSFGQAFAAARRDHGGAGGTFTYEGKQYHTGTKEEEEMKKYRQGTPMVPGYRGGSPAVPPMQAPPIPMQYYQTGTRAARRKLVDEDERKRRELERQKAAAAVSGGRNRGRTPTPTPAPFNILNDPNAEPRFFGPAQGHDRDPITGSLIDDPSKRPGGVPVLNEPPIVHPNASPRAQQTGVMSAAQKEAHWRNVWNQSGGRDQKAKAAYEQARAERAALEASFGGGGDPRVNRQPGSVTDTSVHSAVGGRPNTPAGQLPGYAGPATTGGAVDPRTGLPTGQLPEAGFVPPLGGRPDVPVGDLTGGRSNLAPEDDLGNTIISSTEQATIDSINALRDLGDNEAADALAATLPSNIDQTGQNTVPQSGYDKTYGELDTSTQDKIYAQQEAAIQKRKDNAANYAEYEAAQQAQLNLNEKKRQQDAIGKQKKLDTLRTEQSKLENDLAAATRDVENAKGTDFEDKATKNLADAESALDANKKSQSSIIDSEKEADKKATTKDKGVGKSGLTAEQFRAEENERAGQPVIGEADIKKLEAVSEKLNQGGESGAKETKTTITESKNFLGLTDAQVDKTEGFLKDYFGLEFGDVKKILGLYLASRATGASHAGSLRWAGQVGLAGAAERDKLEQAEQAKEEGRQEKIDALVEYGYTPAQAKASVIGGAKIDLGTASKTQTGKTDIFYSPNGTKINAKQVKIGQDVYWEDKNGNYLDLNVVHQDASRVPNTPEYNERVQKEAKGYSDTFKELKNLHGVVGQDDFGGKQYITDLTPGAVGFDTAGWAIENDVPPGGMGSLIKNAYAQARADSQEGNKVGSFRSYLDSQYIQTQVGAPELFIGKGGDPIPAKDVLATINDYANVLKAEAPKVYGKMPYSTLTSTVIKKARAEWNDKLTDKQRKDFEASATDTQNGFFKFLESELE